MTLNEQILDQLEYLKKEETSIKDVLSFADENWGSNVEGAKEVLEVAAKITRERDYKEAYARVLVYLSKYHLEICDYDKAISSILEAYKIFQMSKDYLNLTECCKILLMANMNLGCIDLAISYGLEGLEFTEEHKLSEHHIDLLLSVAKLYISIGENKHARELVNQLDEVKGYMSKQSCGILTLLLTQLELINNNTETARLYCKTTINIARQIQDEILFAKASHLEARISYVLGYGSSVYKQFQEAYDKAYARKVKDVCIDILLSWSECEISDGNLEAAEVKLQEALNLAKEVKAFMTLSEIYYRLSQVYSQSEKWKEAYESFEACDYYNKLIFNKTSHMWIVRLNNRHMHQELKNNEIWLEKLQAAIDIGKSFTSQLEMEYILDEVYSKVKRLVDMDAIGIAIYNTNHDLEWHFYTSTGEHLEINEGLKKCMTCIGQYCMEEKKDIILDEYSSYCKCCENYQAVEVRDNVLTSVMCTSLLIDSNVEGVIAVGNLKKNAYQYKDMKSLKFIASFLAIALQNAKLFNESKYLAMYDSLTGLYNRRMIFKYGEELFNRLHKVDIIMLDIDHFKRINDLYGHDIGDLVLEKIGYLIRNFTRMLDCVGRYGGEEFIVVIGALEDSAYNIALRLKNEIQKMKIEYSKGKFLQVTASCGVYSHTGNNKDFIDAIKKADRALYAAKKAGRNCVVSYKDIMR